VSIRRQGFSTALNPITKRVKALLECLPTTPT